LLLAPVVPLAATAHACCGLPLMPSKRGPFSGARAGRTVVLEGPW
jgi:hypothetical protein